MTPSTAPDQTDGLLLPGLDGTNPLGFLAALGVLRALSVHSCNNNLSLHWISNAGTWQPLFEVAMSKDEFVCELTNALPQVDEMFELRLIEESIKASPMNKKQQPKWRDKLRFPHNLYRDYLQRLTDQPNTSHAHFAAAWASGTEVEVVDNIDVARRTRFDFTAGNQAFVKMARDARATVNHSSLTNCLFGSWNYVTGAPSMRWDPMDEGRRYALQANDPQSSSKNPIMAEPVANALALQALPLFPMIPMADHANQPGFGIHNSVRSFTWPIWTMPMSLDLVSCLLTLITPSDVNHSLRARGIEAVYRSTIVMPSDRYRNFTPAQRIA